MIDFSTLPRRNKTYAGANGSKIAVMYENELYMLKFPGAARLNKEMRYANGCICEYLGSHIFEIVGIPVQETLLGTFTRNGKEKIVVACKDFTTPDTVIQDFASLKNTIIDSEHKLCWMIRRNEMPASSRCPFPALSRMVRRSTIMTSYTLERIRVEMLL